MVAAVDYKVPSLQAGWSDGTNLHVLISVFQYHLPDKLSLHPERRKETWKSYLHTFLLAEQKFPYGNTRAGEKGAPNVFLINSDPRLQSSDQVYW